MARTLDFALGFLIFSILMACSPTSPDAGTLPRLDILAQAGTMPDGEWNYLPYPAHYGMIGNNHVLLISKASKIGSSRSIKPIGMMTTIEDGKSENWIIANDAHTDYDIDDLENIDDLITNHNGIKSTIERWITNRKGIGQVMLKGWQEAPSLVESNNQ